MCYYSYIQTIVPDILSKKVTSHNGQWIDNYLTKWTTENTIINLNICKLNEDGFTMVESGNSVRLCPIST